MLEKSPALVLKPFDMFDNAVFCVHTLLSEAVDISVMFK